MTPAFFDRVARVTIGKSAGAGKLPIGVQISTPLRITFDITKTPFSISNMGKITINNLSDQTRNMIRQGMVVALEAGYAENGGPQLMFFAEIVDVSHDMTKPEVLTTITAMDGHSHVKAAPLSVSYRKGTTVEKIVNDAVLALGLTLNTSFQYLKFKSPATDSTVAFTGSASDFLDSFCSDNGLQWSVQNGCVKIVNLNSHDNTPARTGYLVGSPRRLFLNMVSLSLNDFSGYEFDALLMPMIEPYNRVSFTSKEVPKGVTLIAQEVHHVGDSHGDKWQTTTRGRDI